MKKKLIASLVGVAMVMGSVETSVFASTDQGLEKIINGETGQQVEVLDGKKESDLDFVSYDKENQAPKFIVGDLSKSKVKTKEEALAYLKNNMTALNLKVGEFKLLSEEKDDLGFTHYKFDYLVDGVSVYGSQIIVHTNKSEKVYAVNGSPESTLENKKYSEDFKITEDQAIKIGMDEEKVTDKEKVTSQKCIKNVSNNWKSVYLVEILNETKVKQYTIEGSTGKVLQVIELDRSANNSSKVKGKGTEGDTKIVNAEIQNGLYVLRDATRTGAIEAYNVDDEHEAIYKSTKPEFTEKKHEAVVDALDNMGKTYDYFLKNHNRDSYDNNGGDIMVDVNYGSDATIDDAFTAMNAGAGVGGYFMFGEGGKINKSFEEEYEGETYKMDIEADMKNFASQLDVVAHEFTHNVTMSSAGLVYQNESGALNESFSDVFGIIIEGNEEDWEIMNGSKLKLDGKEIPYSRSMKEPEKFAQPANMKEYQHLEIWDDGGGVHTNSGIPNKAFYNIASKIGFDKASKVYYRALTTYLVPTSQFIDARSALELAALDIYGLQVKEIVSDGFEAVGINYDNCKPSDSNLKEAKCTIERLNKEGDLVDFNLNVEVAKGDGAKEVLVLDLVTGEIVKVEKINPLENGYKTTIEFKDKAKNDIYGYYVVTSNYQGIAEKLFSQKEPENLDEYLEFIESIPEDFDMKINVAAINFALGNGNNKPVVVFDNWEVSKEYKVGDTVTVGESMYTCIQGHTSQEGWNPEAQQSLWFKLN